MILEDAARLGFDGTLTYIVYNICIRSLRHYCYLVNTRDHLQIKVQRIFSYKKSRSYKKNFPTNKSSYQTVMETIQFLVFFFSFFFLHILDRFPRIVSFVRIRFGSTCSLVSFRSTCQQQWEKASGRNRVAMRIVCKNYLHGSTV